MGVILKCGAVFLHVPKTGGCWVEEALRTTGQMYRYLPHRHADMTRVMNYRKFEKFRPRKWFRDRRVGMPTNPMLGVNYRFCFIRHPLKWYESWWRYMESRNWNRWGCQGFPDGWHPNSALNGLGSPDFNEFVANLVHARPGYVTELYSRYTDERIDFIGKQESLVDDFIQVLNELNVPFDEEQIRQLAPVNVSQTPKERLHWDPSLRELVTKLEYPALVRYGYVKDALAERFNPPAVQLRVAA
ncbi:MAG TPA: hypothetical protein VGJ04_08705 [Pirellulales bacterium]|jgi:hypothetical protein